MFQRCASWSKCGHKGSGPPPRLLLSSLVCHFYIFTFSLSFSETAHRACVEARATGAGRLLQPARRPLLAPARGARSPAATAARPARVHNNKRVSRGRPLEHAGQLGLDLGRQCVNKLLERLARRRHLHRLSVSHARPRCEQPPQFAVSGSITTASSAGSRPVSSSLRSSRSPAASPSHGSRACAPQAGRSSRGNQSRRPAGAASTASLQRLCGAARCTLRAPARRKRCSATVRVGRPRPCRTRSRTGGVRASWCLSARTIPQRVEKAGDVEARTGRGVAQQLPLNA